MPLQSEQLVQHLRRLAAASLPSAESDAVLLERFLHQRDEASFAALVQRHGPMVLGLCRRILGNVHDAEDAFQAAFLVLARKAHTVQPREALTAWLYGVARRMAWKARTTRTKQTCRRRSLTMPLAEVSASPLDELSSREVLALFDEELQRLPRVYRLPLILCCIEGHSQEEAARQLGWTPGSVKGRLERGRARLQARLTRRGLMLSAALMLVEAARGSVAAALAETTIRQSLQFIAGKSVTGTAAALAEMTLRGMSWSRSAIWAGLMSLLLVAAGTAGLALQTLADKPPENEQPPASASEKAEPRKDQQDDPLPPGAIARLGTSRLRGVRGCLAYSPDGKLLAAATGEIGENVTIWEMLTGREICRIFRIAGWVTLGHLAFSADGKRLACSDGVQTRLFDVRNGKELFSVVGQHGVFSADGRTIVTAESYSRNPRVRVWDAATGKPLPQGFSARLLGVAVAADGRTVAVTVASNESGTVVQVADLSKREAIRTFRFQGRQNLALSGDGKTLATADASAVRLWDVASGKDVRAWTCWPESPPVFSADGKRLAWIGHRDAEDKTLYLWTVERDGDKPRIVGAAVNCAEPPCFSPEGKRLAVVTAERIVSVRNVDNGKETPSWEAHDSPILDLAFSADGQQIVSRANESLFIWQTRSGKLLRRSPLLPPGHEYLVPLLPGGYVLTGERTADPLQGRFCLRDLPAGKNVLQFEGRPDVGPPSAVTALGSPFLAVRGRAGEICVLDASERRCTYRLDPKGAASGLKLSADGNVLLWYRRADAGVEIHVHRHQEQKTLRLPDVLKGDSVTRCLDNYACLSPDGHWLVLPGEKGELRRWDAVTGKEAAPLTEALLTVWGFRWSPDGRILAVPGSGSPSNVIDDGTRQDVRVWDVATGVRLRHLTRPDRGGTCMRFSGDGRTLVTANAEGIIDLFEVATGRERGRFRGHLWGQIGALAFSSDGRMLASGGYDSQGFVWDLTGRMPDGQWRTARLSAEQRRAAWEALASADARAAYRAMWQLASDPEGTIALFREQLHSVARPKPDQVTRWLAALDSAEFAERERAAQELEQAGEAVAGDLRRALTNKPTLEVRRRIEALLAKLDSVPQGRQLQALRAVEVLEHVNTAEGRTILRKLAAGVAGARLTEEAQQALRRGG